jgi:hypothetical protein
MEKLMEVPIYTVKESKFILLSVMSSLYYLSSCRRMSSEVPVSSFICSLNANKKKRPNLNPNIETKVYGTYCKLIIYIILYGNF